MCSCSVALTNDVNAEHVDSYYDGDKTHSFKRLIKTGTINGVSEYNTITIELIQSPFEEECTAVISFYYDDDLLLSTQYVVKLNNQNKLEYKNQHNWDEITSNNEIAPTFIPVFVAILAPGVANAIIALIVGTTVAITLNELLKQLDQKEKEEGNTAIRTTENLPGDITIILYDGVPSIMYCSGKAANMYHLENEILSSLKDGYNYYFVYQYDSSNLVICPLPLDLDLASSILKLNSERYNIWSTTSFYAQLPPTCASKNGIYVLPPLNCMYDDYYFRHYHYKEVFDGEYSKSVSFYGFIFGENWVPEDNNE